MPDAREKLRDEVKSGLAGRLRDMLSDPGPYIQDMDASAEVLADAVLARLCDEGDRSALTGWMVKKYGQHQVLEVIEFDMQDTFDDGWSWNVYTKRPAEYDD